MNADIHIGTCGYSFPDWKDVVYPPNVRPSLYLVYYARTLGFNAVELDSSFYHMPTISLIEALMQKTPPGFLFTVKAHRSMTHDVWNAMKPANPGRPAFPELASGLKNTALLAPAFTEFWEAVIPMADAGRLGTVVLQYPPWFRDTPEDRRFLLMTRDLLPRLSLSIEFRDRSWHNRDALTFLRQEHLGYVAVDEPQLRNLLPLVPAVTSDVAYLRLHGRNPNWFGASKEERYDYLYSKEELEQMLPSIRTMAASAPLMFIMTNNCHRGQAVQNARDLQAMLLFPAQNQPQQ
jgi:uncharacterized protein YecE (DUF72 family)